MKNIITKEHVEKVQFYQMPKAFFTNPLYTSMRCESKLAYMLMLDLLPLSIKNNWVNDKNQVFVKLSRSKLMALLNIKGTQKAAQVIRELEDKKLIYSRRPGLNRCNEIYLALPQALIVKKKAKPKPPASLSADLPRVKDQEDKLEKDIEKVKDLLENQVYMEDLRLKYDDDIVDEIGNNICEMYLNETTRIGKQDKPRLIIRNVIKQLKMHHIENVIDTFKEITLTRKIYNHKQYIQTMIYNSIYETQSKTLGHIRYNFGY